MLALQGDFVPDAVNVQAGGIVAEDVRPPLPLAEKLGRVFTALAAGLPQSATVHVRGEIVEYDVSVLQLAVLKGLFADIIEEPVTFVNAPLLAAERGVQVDLATDRDSPDYRTLVTVRGTLGDGSEVTVSGTLSSQRQIAKLTDVNGFDMDLRPEEHLLFIRYRDRPGVVGTIGAELGRAGINIAGAQVSRATVGGEALMAIAVDSAVPAELLAVIADSIGATLLRAVDLSPR
ncbi:MAG: ACT domain-containing protein [Geodermatophilaceae bacterium]